jgi:hypothetical protein
MAYSDDKLSLYLDNYWGLFEGISPNTGSSSNQGFAPMESALIIKADVDEAISILDVKAYWGEIVNMMNDLYRDCWDPRHVFDDKKVFHSLSRYQKAIVRYHLKINSVGYMDDDEFKTAMKARAQMLRYLNSRVTPREFQLVCNVVSSLQW